MLLNLSRTLKTQREHMLEREKKITQMRRVVSSWDKKELQAYVYNHNKSYPCSDAGMAAILERFTECNEFQIGHMSEELKAGFDIVLSIARNKKITLLTTDLIFDFIKSFEEVIHNYDRQSAQTYYHKLINAYEKSIELVNAKIEIDRGYDIRY